MNNTSANDVLNYLTRLKQEKQKLGSSYYFTKDDDLYVIYDEKNIPRYSMTQKIFDIFQEIEV